MYLILFDAEDNAKLEVFHDGLDVIGLRTAEEEKDRRKRSDGKGRKRSAEEDSTEKI